MPKKNDLQDMETAPLPGFEDMVGTPTAPEAAAEPAAIPPPSSGPQYTMETPVFDRDETFIPRLRLAQGLTPEVQAGKARPGQWVLAGYDPVDSVEFIPVMFSRSRELRDEDNNILCSSGDALTGVGAPGGLCANCQKSKWAGTKENRIPPECQFAYTYVGLSISHQAVVSVDFRRTGLNAGKLLNTIVSARGLGKCCVTLSSRTETRGRKTWNVIVVLPSQTDKQTLALASAMARMDIQLEAPKEAVS